MAVQAPRRNAALQMSQISEVSQYVAMQNDMPSPSCNDAGAILNSESPRLTSAKLWTIGRATVKPRWKLLSRQVNMIMRAWSAPLVNPRLEMTLLFCHMKDNVDLNNSCSWLLTLP